MSALTLEEAQDHLDKYRKYIADKKSPRNPDYMYYRSGKYYEDTVLQATGSTWGVLIVFGILFWAADGSFFKEFLIPFIIGAVIFGFAAIGGDVIQKRVKKDLRSQNDEHKIVNIIGKFPQLISSDIQKIIGWNANNVNSNWENVWETKYPITFHTDILYWDV